MIMNNLDPEVAENPDELVVYAGIGKAARTWKDFDLITDTLKTLGSNDTLLVQSGKPVGVFRTHAEMSITDTSSFTAGETFLLLPDFKSFMVFFHPRDHSVPKHNPLRLQK